MYIITCEIDHPIDHQSRFYAADRALRAAALGRWDGEAGVREGQDGRDTCTPMADSSQCVAKTTPIL